MQAKIAQDVLKMHQHDPKMVPKFSKMVPRCPKMAEEGSKMVPPRAEEVHFLVFVWKCIAFKPMPKLPLNFIPRAEHVHYVVYDDQAIHVAYVFSSSGGESTAMRFLQTSLNPFNKV